MLRCVLLWISLTAQVILCEEMFDSLYMFQAPNVVWFGALNSQIKDCNFCGPNLLDCTISQNETTIIRKKLYLLLRQLIRYSNCLVNHCQSFWEIFTLFSSFFPTTTSFETVEVLTHVCHQDWPVFTCLPGIYSHNLKLDWSLEDKNRIIGGWVFLLLKCN